MRYLRLAYLVTGLVLLGVTFYEADLGAVWHYVSDFGPWGTALITALFVLAYLADAAAWQLTLPGIPGTARWLQRLFVVRTIGEAFNDITPFASLGGEPVKSILLKTHYGIGYRHSGASLVLAKTLITLSLVVFLSIGLALSLTTPALPAAYKVFAAIGLTGLTACTYGFFIVQRFRLTSVTARWLHRTGLYKGVERVLHVIHEFDDQIVAFYVDHRYRLAGSLAFAFASWMLGIVEIQIIMYGLGHPVSFAEAWVIEALAQLVRAATFFIPAGIGAQEGTFLLVLGAMTGSPALGVAVGVVRRFRQLIWLGLGVAMSWMLSLRPRFAAVKEEPSAS